MFTLMNLTPHAIVLRGVEDTTIPPSGIVARVTMTPGVETTITGIPVPVMTADTAGEVENLPAPQDGVFFLVSGVVGSAVKGRTDILVPGTGPQDGAIRNEKGHIVAVTRLKVP